MTQLKQAVIVDAIRTPIGKYAGHLSSIRPDDLMALLLREMAKRHQLDFNELEDVIIGCTNQAGEDCRNVARMAALLADFPFEVPAQTVNRLCGSSMQAIITASQGIQTDNGQVYLAGGVESMSRGPMVSAKSQKAFSFGNLTLFDSTLGWRFPNPKLIERIQQTSLGDTAENIYDQYKISREVQDQWAYNSHMKALNARDSGSFKAEVIPVEVQRKKSIEIIELDESIRADTTLLKLASLRPAFRTGGTVTAGNSSPLSDGAALTLIMNEDEALKKGHKVYYRIVSYGVCGVDPNLMGIGPIPASQAALKKAGLSIEDIDLVEINEAFAIQVLACIQGLNIPPEKVNINGGALALGHPLGCSGARVVTTLMQAMKKKDCSYGLATMCIGVGQGIALILKKVIV